MMKSVVNLLLVFLLIFSNASFAQGFLAMSSPAKLQNSLKVTSAQQAAQLVKQRYGGKILKIQNKNANGQRGYRVKLVKSDGQVISVWVDAKSGRLVQN